MKSEEEIEEKLSELSELRFDAMERNHAMDIAQIENTIAILEWILDDVCAFPD